MKRYIDSGLLKKEIEKRMHICDGVFERDSDTYYQGKAVAYQETLSLIDSLQQEQPSLPSNLDEAAKKIVIQLHPCMEYSSILGDHLTMGELVELVKVGANWQQEQSAEKTCKDCGFYENNCPYIRDKFIPYPSKVCKDYTYSVIKEQEQPSEDLDADITAYLNTHYSDRFKDSKIVDFTTTEAFELARHFYELGKQSREPVNEDLEEAARHSEMLTYPMPEDGDIEKVMKVQEARIFHDIGFKAGAEWMAKRLKK